MASVVIPALALTLDKSLKEEHFAISCTELRTLETTNSWFLSQGLSFQTKRGSDVTGRLARGTPPMLVPVDAAQDVFFWHFAVPACAVPISLVC